MGQQEQQSTQHTPGPAFSKTVEMTDTDMVIATVRNAMGKRVGLEFFFSPFDSKESRFRKAHKWADDHIALCEHYQSGEPMSRGDATNQPTLSGGWAYNLGRRIAAMLVKATGSAA